MVNDRIENTEKSTLVETISEHSEDIITYNNFSILHKINNIHTPTDNILYDYIDELKTASTVVELSSEEYSRYMYRPDLLAYDLYGNINYDFIVMALNDISDPRKFTMKKVRLIDTEYFTTIVNAIYATEQDYINKNRELENI